VSETDTEIIAQLIGIELKLKQITLKQAVANVLPKLEGQWALVCVDAQDNSKIVCTRRDNPLLIGYSEQGDALHLASERDAFELYCNKLTILHDDELVELSLENVNLPGFGIFPPERVLTMTDRLINAPKEPSYPFKFWFEEEIQEQPETLRLSMRGSG
jgi:glucosamine--fructose-6-phosphate aminotransferase (isomerizing)